jgi:hypothetical protein
MFVGRHDVPPVSDTTVTDRKGAVRRRHGGVGIRLLPDADEMGVRLERERQGLGCCRIDNQTILGCSL